MVKFAMLQMQDGRKQNLLPHTIRIMPETAKLTTRAKQSGQKRSNLLLALTKFARNGKLH